VTLARERREVIRQSESRGVIDGYDSLMARSEEIARALETGTEIPPLVFVAHDASGPFIALEGNTRLTAFARAGLEPTGRVLLGLSGSIGSWPFAGSPT
jgi:hypothetical protein